MQIRQRPSGINTTMSVSPLESKADIAGWPRQVRFVPTATCDTKLRGRRTCLNDCGDFPAAYRTAIEVRPFTFLDTPLKCNPALPPSYGSRSRFRRRLAEVRKAYALSQAHPAYAHPCVLGNRWVSFSMNATVR